MGQGEMKIFTRMLILLFTLPPAVRSTHKTWRDLVGNSYKSCLYLSFLNEQTGHETIKPHVRHRTIFSP